jgi:hypothetical protein
MNQRSAPRAIPWTIAIAIVLIAGCSQEPFAMVPVSGAITFEDGSLIQAERIVVCFVPQVDPVDAKTHPLSGRAEVDIKTGAFTQATSHKYGDGLVRGTHKVYLEVYPKAGIAPPPIPREYSTVKDTPLTYDTEKLECIIKLPKSRPKSGK